MAFITGKHVPRRTFLRGAGVVATGAGAGIGFCTGAVDNSAQPASTRGAKKTTLIFQTSFFAWRPSRNR